VAQYVGLELKLQYHKNIMYLIIYEIFYIVALLPLSDINLRVESP
jgi:hypothetical protein